MIASVGIHVTVAAGGANPGALSGGQNRLPSGFVLNCIKIGEIRMSTITFDTLKFVRTLKAAGVPENQAEAISEAFRDAQGEAELATKRDIDDLRRDMDARFIQMEQHLIIKLGTLMALSIGIVAALVKLL
jgi:hypothetical protein